MAKQTLPNFSKGEISPQLHGRVDSEAYKTGLATARNLTVHTYGGVSSRHGTRFIGDVKDYLGVQRLIPFSFKTEDQYILEFGDQYMRVIRNDAQVYNTGLSITGITQASPGVVTATAHGFSNGQDVLLTSIVGMTELNTRTVIVRNVTANTFEMEDRITGTAIDTSGFTAYTSGGTASAPYEIVTPFLAAELFDVKFSQTAETMTLVHPNHEPRQLTRTDHDAWTITTLDTSPQIPFPGGLGITVNTAGSETTVYKVTAVDGSTGEESLPALATGSPRTITNITQADPAVVTTSAAHLLETGDEIEIQSVVGMTEVNNKRYQIIDLTATTFSLVEMDGDDVDSTGFTAYSSAGSAIPAFSRTTGGATSFDNTLAYGSVEGAIRYRIYRSIGGQFGKIAETSSNLFTDTNQFIADTSIGPPIAIIPFADSTSYPGAVGFYQQRQVFGGESGSPDTSRFSKIGTFGNFTQADPLQSDDAITATLAGNQVNNIRHYVALNELLVFTSGAEWEISSTDGAGLTPTTIRQRPQSSWGSSQRPPIVMGPSVIFVGRDGNNVRSFGFSENISGYTGNDLNITAQHLTDGKEIVDWAFTNSPEKQIFMVMDDGGVVTLTYDLELKTVGWTRWDTYGFFKSVASLREGGDNSEDSVYFIVERFLNGNLVKYIEVWRQEFFNEVEDCFFVDSGLSLDNPVDILFVLDSDPVGISTVTAHGYSNGDTVDIENIQWDVTIDDDGNDISETPLNGDRFTIQNASGTAFELVGEDGTAFPTYLDGGKVRKAVTTVGGLWHLEGETVVALADGNVVRNLTVTNGRVTFSRPFSRIHIGLQFVADFETLNIENEEDSTIQGSLKKINDVTVRFFKSRGLLIGPNSSNLVEMKQRENENYGQPTDLLSGDKEIHIPGNWNSRGRIFLRQVDPLPMTILAVVQQYDRGEE